ncbi:prepilin-type N-terminal cleavage/methylation domain-containing protein [Opitutaceae bacterium TAV1]|nr:N-terminal cleavage protein [Opitutaceae bacterium TAV5]EIP97423.1 prepilin-type N-terminal cleavage/methylation domain-containing protein [Opitutaceae bacterium TAV1]
MKNASRPRQGFTLIELLTVIAIIGILAGIMIPVVGSVRKKAGMATSMSNLRQLGAATQIFVTENNQKLPVYDGDSNTGHYWLHELWKILHPGRPLPSMPPSPDTYDRFMEVYGRTVFVTPLMEKKDACRSYGYNAYLSQYTTSGIRTTPATPLQFSQIAMPSRTVLIGDSYSINLEMGKAAPRNDGWVYCVFADGHVDRLRPPESGNDFPPPEQKRMPYSQASMFWRGVDRSPTGTALTPW